MAPSSSILELSTISLCEIAIKHSKGKLNVNDVAVQAGIQDFQVRILPYAASHAYRMFGLPLHHSDPFDRMIIAQALAEEIPIVTSDSKFRLYRDLEVIW
jgi:PIN domain nuclease of toxin-antitoxin system